MKTCKLGVAGLGLLLAALMIWTHDAGTADAGNQAPAKASAPAPGPIMDTHGLMELFNKPLYELLHKEMQQQPSSDESWQTIADRGLQAAEVTNLIAIREIGNEHSAAWNEHVSELRQSALNLAEAAEAKDWQKTSVAYRSLIQNCNDCHQAMAPNKAPQLEP